LHPASKAPYGAGKLAPQSRLDVDSECYFKADCGRSGKMPVKKSLAHLALTVRKTIQDFGMLSGGEHVLVAVSGGPDSIALLLCLHKLAPNLNLTLTVAHLNHGIRGTEADADEDFVRRVSADLDLPFVSEILT
jgi:3'-phosphoadenosine 5'-phosphosulfate sulfotransferase (PAPS reductase)/FAD synthetase